MAVLYFKHFPFHKLCYVSWLCNLFQPSPRSWQDQVVKNDSFQVRNFTAAPQAEKSKAILSSYKNYVKRKNFERSTISIMPSNFQKNHMLSLLGLMSNHLFWGVFNKISSRCF